ncbi:hypothetical protein B0H11DRAFT_2204826 [Mycena galericulata]|nr:hypothetical protein B0H11DRAFT_2204826 [Mycena galericulata]
MPSIANTPSTTWFSYMKDPMPPLPYRPVGDEIKTETTHPAGQSSMAACGAATTLKASRTIIPRELEGCIERFVKNSEPIIAEKNYGQPLYNEQGVAEVYFKNVIVPVKEALDILLLQMLEKKELKQAGYFFNIRQQQSSPSGDRTRSDHYLVLEHMDGVQELPDNSNAPQKQKIVWRTPKIFAKMFTERKEWEAAPTKTGQAPEYPRMVLCIIEEKKPNVIVEKEFNANYESSTSVGGKNVKNFLPQIKKYSVDAACPHVMLTDYLTTMLLYVKTPGATFNEVKKKIETTDDKPEVWYSKLDVPPRYSLFSSAIQRLLEAELIRVNKDKSGLDVV